MFYYYMENKHPLTDECLKTFIQHTYSKSILNESMTPLDCEFVFNSLEEVYQNAIIVEFFDTIGYIADVQPVFDGDENALSTVKWMPNPIILPITDESELYDFEYEKSRQEALKVTITKLNEIYNAKHI